MFIWLLVLVSVIRSLFCWGVSHLVAIVITGFAPNLVWPGITKFLLHSNFWILCFPLPFLIYAGFISRHSELTPDVVFRFAGALILALSILTCSVAFASLLPFAELYFRLSPSGDK